jgi:serine/threonine-protein kinase
MPLPAGRRLGVFEVIGLLGAGGMGEVYRARDTRLGREIAIKVLPDAFAGDEDRLRRFEREAQLLASLNHSGIAAIHGFEESDGIRYLVLELVAGETLAQRLARGRLPIEDALSVGRQVAAAMEDAHARGVVHRDLKPANIKITPEGKVKVLDFGLAKAFLGDAPDSDPTDSPTLTRAGSGEGVILGTAAYMSPEQARGKPLDKRTDVWSFGCVLYEALAGRRPFAGETSSDTLAAVLRAEPDWSALPAAAPALVRSLLRRCLQKDPDRRLHDIADARIEIEEALAEPAAESAPVSAGKPRFRQAAPLSGLAGLVLGALLVRVLLSQPASSTPAHGWYPKRLSVALPPGFEVDDLANDNNALAISGDGRRLVFGVADTGGVKLYVRDLDQLEPGFFGGTGDNFPSDPFLSPDGQWLGFYSKAKLWKAPIQGGGPTLLCDAPWVQGASWGEDGTLLFAPSNVGGLARLPAAGGKAKTVAEPDAAKGEVSYRWPQILPGGKDAVFTVMGASGEKTIALLSLETGRWRPLFKDGTRPRYAAGHLFFVRGSSLLVVPFVPPWRDPVAPPVPVLENVWASSSTGFAYLDVSANGSLVYVAKREEGQARLVWADRQGGTQPLSRTEQPYRTFALSPDGLRLAATTAGRDQGVWVCDLKRDAWNRLTDEPCDSVRWSRDGKRLAFAAGRTGAKNAYWMPADGSGPAEQLTQGAGWQLPAFFSPDGAALAYEELTTGGFDLILLPLQGDRRPKPFLATQFNERFVSLSPDGRWFAYQSDESGDSAVYVRRYDGTGGKWRVAPAIGVAPIWARSGRELFYRDGQKMMVVPVKTEPDFSAGSPQLLFEFPSPFLNFDVAPDGRRFAMLMPTRQTILPPQIVVIPDWLEEVKAKLRAATQ